MGLFKMIGESVSTTISDQIREYIYCDVMPNDVLLRRGYKRDVNGKGNSVNKGTDNIISQGSAIAVNEGQFMIVVEDGKIVDFTGEAGSYIFDKSTEPTMLYGGFGKGLIGSFKTMTKRFTFGGDSGKDQRVYFINVMQLFGNKFGTAVPIPFAEPKYGLSLSLQGHGEYTTKIVDPLLFFESIAGNVPDEFRFTDDMISMFKTEFVAALRDAFGEISNKKIPYESIIAEEPTLTAVMKDILSASWQKNYGLNVSTISLAGIQAKDDNVWKDYNELNKMSVYKNADMRAAQASMAQAEWLKGMGEGASKGGNSSNPMDNMMGMMSMNMMQNMMNGGQQPVQQQQMQQPQAPVAQPSGDSWTCGCGTSNTGKFCQNCGSGKPASDWTCSCGTVNSGKFCQNCGTPKPAGDWTCSCGTTNSGKFCQNCGNKQQ